MKTLTKAGVAAGLCLLGVAAWWRKNPSACPYGQRFWIQVPRPFITRARLLSVLNPRPGERILEVGPGTGYYTLDVARSLGPDGRLDIVDIQQEMLDHTLRRARNGGITNVVAVRGDARALAYPEEIFDAAYLATVLGEVPDQDEALAELHRVLKPGGRLVVAEVLGDPHYVSLRSLQRRAQAAGFAPGKHHGAWLGYFAVLEKGKVTTEQG